MIFYETRVGSPGAVYPDHKRVRLPFSFPTPVATAHAMLRSFHLHEPGADSELRDVAVVLTTHFDPAQSATSGEVEVEFQLADDGGSAIGLDFDVMEAQIGILVVGM